MVMKRFWYKRDHLGNANGYTGWFLLGFVPLYIKQVSYGGQPV